MARQWFKLVVVHPGTRRQFDVRDVRVDLDNDPDEVRDDLVEIAKSDSYLTTGSVGDWIAEFEARVFTEREYAKGAYDGGWGTPERTLRFRR